jgi:taurine transport system substrate-binding protein
MRTKPLLALVVVAALGATGACANSSSGSSGGKLGIGYFQSATLGPEVLVAGNPALAKKVGQKIKLTAIDSGVAGLAELRGGAFPFVSGVGNPPVTGSISQDTKLKVIYAEYFDAAQLIVPKSITSNDQLAGKTVGALQGSSEDFEIRGWLKTQGLDTKTKVVGFPSEAAISAAYKAHKIDAGYVEIAQALDLIQNAGGRKVVTAEEIAKLGYPSVNVLAVTDAYAAKHQKTVRKLVCQVMHSQELVRTGKGDDLITHAAPSVGAKPDEALPATKVLPFVSATDQTAYFAKDGGLAKAYKLTGQFLVDQGRTKTVPTDAQIADHIDGSYVAQALKDGCDK